MTTLFNSYKTCIARYRVVSERVQNSPIGGGISTRGTLGADVGRVVQERYTALFRVFCYALSQIAEKVDITPTRKSVSWYLAVYAFANRAFELAHDHVLLYNVLIAFALEEVTTGFAVQRNNMQTLFDLFLPKGVSFDSPKSLVTFVESECQSVASNTDKLRVGNPRLEPTVLESVVHAALYTIPRMDEMYAHLNAILSNTIKRLQNDQKALKRDKGLVAILESSAPKQLLSNAEQESPTTTSSVVYYDRRLERGKVRDGDIFVEAVMRNASILYDDSCDGSSVRLQRGRRALLMACEILANLDAGSIEWIKTRCERTGTLLEDKSCVWRSTASKLEERPRSEHMQKLFEVWYSVASAFYNGVYDGTLIRPIDAFLEKTNLKFTELALLIGLQPTRAELIPRRLWSLGYSLQLHSPKLMPSDTVRFKCFWAGILTSLISLRDNSTLTGAEEQTEWTWFSFLEQYSRCRNTSLYADMLEWLLVSIGGVGRRLGPPDAETVNNGYALLDYIHNLARRNPLSNNDTTTTTTRHAPLTAAVERAHGRGSERVILRTLEGLFNHTNADALLALDTTVLSFAHRESGDAVVIPRRTLIFRYLPLQLIVCGLFGNVTGECIVQSMNSWLDFATFTLTFGLSLVSENDLVEFMAQRGYTLNAPIHQYQFSGPESSSVVESIDGAELAWAGHTLRLASMDLVEHFGRWNDTLRRQQQQPQMGFIPFSGAHGRHQPPPPQPRTQSLTLPQALATLWAPEEVACFMSGQFS